MALTSSVAAADSEKFHAECKRETGIPFCRKGPISRTTLIAMPDPTCVAYLGSLCTMNVVFEVLISRCIIGAKSRRAQTANTTRTQGPEAGPCATCVGEHGKHGYSTKVQAHMSMQASAAVSLHIFRRAALNCQRSGH